MFPPILRHGFCQQFAQRACLGLAIASTSAGAAMAQTPVSLDSCAPPAKSEYLLLVVVQAPDAEEKLNQTLPPSVKAPTCNYLGTRVARMGGFRSPEDADAWASYLRKVAALPAFIAQPPKAGETTIAAAPALPQASPQPKVSVPELGAEPAVASVPSRPAPATPVASSGGAVSSGNAIPGAASVPKPDLSPRNGTTRYPEAAVAVPEPGQPSSVTATTPTPPIRTATANTATFSPKSLASGYVVLVDYGTETAIANQVQATLQRPVGLASYGQRSYLMAEYSADSAVAISTLRDLSRRGFQAILVDSQGVTVLTETVR